MTKTLISQDPKEYATLKDVEGKDWNNDFAYKERDFKGQEIFFASSQRIPKLLKLDPHNHSGEGYENGTDAKDRL